MCGGAAGSRGSAAPRAGRQAAQWPEGSWGEVIPGVWEAARAFV